MRQAPGAARLGVAVNPAGTRVFVTNYADDTLSVLGTASNTVLATVRVGRQPFGVAVHPASTRLYVANVKDDSLSVLEAHTQAAVATVPVGDNPFGVAEETTFPAHKGVAGWVLQHDRAALVEDAGSDPRFYAEVDRVTGATTRTILCAPLRTPGGNIGVVEVINPLRRPFDAADLAFLEAMAADIAVACEKARLYDRLRREAADLRRLCRTVAVGIAVLGLVFVVGATYTQLALALPLREVATRPAMLIGGLLGVTGVAIAAIAGRWPIAPRGETASSA